MIILHGTLTRDQFLLWAETDQSDAASTVNQPAAFDKSQPIAADPPAAITNNLAALLPHAATYSQLREALVQGGLSVTLSRRQNAQTTVWLPTLDNLPLVSSAIIGLAAENLEEDYLAQVRLQPWVIPVIRLQATQLVEILCHLVDREQIAPGVIIGQDLQFWSIAMRFSGSLVGKQQFLPAIKITNSGVLACWDPVFLGEDGAKLLQLANGMPAICLAFDNMTDGTATNADAHKLVLDFVGIVADSLIRKGTERNRLPVPAFSSRDIESNKSAPLHVRWLTALRDESPWLEASEEEVACLFDQIAEWRRPVEIASDSPFRLCFRLEEPNVNEADTISEWSILSGKDSDGTSLDAADEHDIIDAELSEEKLSSESDSRIDIIKSAIAANESTPALSGRWYLRFLLQSIEDPTLILPVETVLSPAFEELQLLRGTRVTAREYLFRALGQAVRLYGDLAKSFDQQQPCGVSLDTFAAHDFLTHKAMVLKNAGFSVQLPAWWTNKSKLSVKMNIREGQGLLSLDDIAKFDWQAALGETPITLEEIQRLTQLKLPLICMQGTWTELAPERLASILDFLKKQASSKASGRELVRMALGDVKLPEGVMFGGVSGDDLITDVVNKLQGQIDFESVAPDKRFAGRLRDYQLRGLSWLEFLRTAGFGACLADDMGLGKTVQTLAFIQRTWHATPKHKRLPTLLVCPTSVLSNWQREAEKFTPELPVILHHGIQRMRGKELIAAARNSCLVLTTYSLRHRDISDLKRVQWEASILDEAQNIKNPQAQQTQAALSIRTRFRVALSGTPVENSVADLWSLMNFLNPGFLGRYADFQQRFFVPIQVFQDSQKTQQLRKLTAPFILRRLKTDKSILPDLPEKSERNAICNLTKEQASLYAAVVADATRDIDSISGMKRKALVLTTFMRLKQICDHPALLVPDRMRIGARSGKLKRLTEALSAVLGAGERALVFTQFKQMGDLIQSHLQTTFGAEVLFLHGGVERSARERMVHRFQTEQDGPRIFVLSLKAGGTGINLTRANHVFHFDRWWNPAVEDQATDRAFRIGQDKNVQVHKFVCAGTVEEQVDAIINGKKNLADSMIGAGEGWLTELSTAQLRDIFELRTSALMD